jgi:hypothetical protein
MVTRRRNAYSRNVYSFNDSNNMKARKSILAIILAVIAIVVIINLSNCGSKPVSSLSSIDSDSVEKALKNGIDFGGTTVKYSHTIKAVTTTGDGSSASPYWVVVDAYDDDYSSYDAFLHDEVQSAAALAHAYSENSSVQKVVWNASAKASAGEDISVLQVVYLTGSSPSNDATVGDLLTKADTYTIKDALYSGLDMYKTVAQKKE